LALAGELDVLLAKKDIRVLIPDMIRFEVLRHIDKPRVREIDDWSRKNAPDRVSVVQTEEFDDFQVLLSAKPNAKTKSRGEVAASEVLSRDLSDGDEIGILLFEDGDVRANRYFINAPDNVLMLSTAQFLMALEQQSIINSAADILDSVTSARGLEVKDPHMHATPGAEDREADWGQILAGKACV
jgi:hypothetical protein